MHFFKTESGKAALTAFLFMLGLFAASLYSRPIFPVDETRYLTVAWEMYSQKSFILPTLNFEPYHHKPPVLFWLICLLWSVFGISQSVAMAAPYIISLAAALGVFKLAKTLKPDNADFARNALLVFLGCLPFVIYSNLIMFDMLITAETAFAAVYAWRLLQTDKAQQKTRNTFILGCILGLGMVSKGPVIWLHVLLPALLTALTIKDINKKAYIITLLKALGISALLALCWGIPAILKGGEEFARYILWEQTAGRVSKAFDHARPFYWYAGFIPLFLMPWLFWGRIIKTAISLKTNWPALNEQKKLFYRHLALWFTSVFICFCLISGKQVHYLLPLTIPLSLLLADFLGEEAKTAKGGNLAFAFTLLLAAIPLIAKAAAAVFADFFEAEHLAENLQKIPLIPSALCFIAIIALKFTLAQRNKVLALSVSMLLVMITLMIEAKESYFNTYDLTPLAKIIQQNPEREVGYLRNYNGEFGFLARMNKPVKQIEAVEVKEFFNKNPQGILFTRGNSLEEFKDFDILYSMPYKTGKFYVVLVPKNTLAKYRQ